MLELQQSLRYHINSLEGINPWWGLTRFSILGGLFLTLITLAWQQENLLGFSLITALAGFPYAFWLICTHDCTHYTLTGWIWFDSIAARLLSWPMLWPYGIYSQIHLLHHGWNSVDLRDPERVQWTQEEYDQANSYLHFYIHWQWLIDIFILGGLGLIIKTFYHGLLLRKLRSKLTREIILDISGMVIFHGILGGIALTQGVFWRYLIFWVILERIIGTIIQMRDHLEHYGCWTNQEGYFLKQLYGTRNLPANPLTNWLMGGLPYHSVHHAFPDLSFNQLPKAWKIVEDNLQQQGLPSLEVGRGYLGETLFWFRRSQLIKNAAIQDSKESPGCFFS
jgi:fatty acid desaturase